MPESAIEGLLDAALAGGLGSAAAVSIGDGGREVLQLVRGAAWTGGPAIDAAARFDLASLTKPIATAAIAMALPAELLDLGAPVRRYVPAAATTGTLAQLLGHGAGCAAHVEFWRTLEPGYAALVDAAARHPAGEPGVATVYSDLGYIQAGAALEHATSMPLRAAFAHHVADPLGLAATTFGPIDPAIAVAVATEGDIRGSVHDENCALGGGACGHAGLFAPIGDVATFAREMLAVLAGERRGRFDPERARAFVTTQAAPATSWRLGWDTPSPTPGVSHAGDRWPRAHAIGHLGFTGTSIWLDPPRGRWSILLTNRVHPTRGGDTAERIKALRRAVNDAAIALTDR